MPFVTGLYAALLSLLLIWLSLQIIGIRRGQRIAFGDACNKRLVARIRAHANFAEYTPMVLLLMMLAELLGAPSWLLHATGAPFLAGRLVHARGLLAEPHNVMLRTVGMVVTFIVITILALTVLWLVGQRLLLG
jgi:uncharacterized protein